MKTNRKIDDFLATAKKEFDREYSNASTMTYEGLKADKQHEHLEILCFLDFAQKKLLP